ncbi:HEAT repeat domain-containing protein [Actinomadura sp. 6N118]|uniref:HEAT repeat domain-containing protein n=1 Tax=Actinomadura sp. 6N118 TaxID=3375151 RepID=UPI00379FA4EB
MSAVVAFEERNGIRLPDGYRAFITTLGNGGPGPYQGLEPLDTGVTSHQLSGEFPYHPERLDESYEATYWNAYRGTLMLNRQDRIEWDYHEDVDPRTLLVVSGPGRGRMVMVDWEREYFRPIYHPAPDFLAWYEEWLDRLADRRPEGRAEGRTRFWETDFDRPGWDSRAVRDHPEVEEAVWAARMIRARYNRWGWPELSEPHCAELAEAAAGSPSPRVRAAALWALCRARRNIGAFVMPMLRDPEPGVRLLAMKAVTGSAEDLGAERVRDALRPMLSDPDPVVRVKAIYHLATHGEWTAGVLEELIRHGQARVRIAAAGVLPSLPYHLSDERMRPLLAAARPLLGDDDPAVRAAAVGAFGSLGAPWSRAMVAAAVTDPDVRVRREAAFRVLHFADTGLLAAVLGVLLEDDDIAIRYQTLGLLASHRSASPLLWTGLAHARLAESDPSVRRMALAALVNAGAPPPEREWPSLLTDPDPDLRRRAAYLAGHVHQPPAGPLHQTLHDLLNDQVREVRGNAARSLEQTCDDGCLPVLEAAHENEDDRVNRYVLGKILARLHPRS